VVLIFRDASETREAETRLRENDKRKDEFLATLAHELRNPLAAMGNAVALSTRSRLQEHIAWSMEVINRQIKHLARLIDDLLDVSRINSGKIELRRDLLDATPILDSAVETVRPLADKRKHELSVSIDRGNLWVNADPTRLEQVVTNLLTNAAKYTENGGHISLTAGHEGGEIVITVKDSGVGIPPEKLPEMFELFAQGDRTLARSEGGLGIGLTVVKKLVQMHGGNITARSDGIDKGSEISIHLPAAQRPASVKAPDKAPAESTRHAVRILVVDDNVDMAKGLARLLQLLGHHVQIAHDGSEAFEAARAQRPEFVLLDIGLPDMDGYEVAARLRHDDCCQGAVFIAISGYGQDEDLRRSKEAGFDHHLVKPIDQHALLTLLAQAGANA
jgi:CheY-like chemotaxis protein/nitrogen-specific signal transduction histidine kinase